MFSVFLVLKLASIWSLRSLFPLIFYLEEKQKSIDIESICELLDLVLGSQFHSQVNAFVDYLKVSTTSFFCLLVCHIYPQAWSVWHFTPQLTPALLNSTPGSSIVALALSLRVAFLSYSLSPAYLLEHIAK